MRRLAIVFATLTIALGVLASPAAASPNDHDNDGINNRRDLCPTVRGRRADGCPTANWRLTDLDGPPPADWSFAFGSLGWKPVAGDWGDFDSVGGFDPSTGTWHLRISVCHCSAVVHFHFDVDVPGRHLPIAGDWDGDGLDGIGIYTPSTGTFYLRNSPSAGSPDATFAFGGRQPARYVRALAGDWDGDGTDSVGLFRTDTDRWRLRNANTAGPADVRFAFGRPGATEQALAGDWDGNGTSTPGLMEEEGIFYLRNANSAGAADVQVTFGGSGQRAVVGDWDLTPDGDDTVGIVRR